MGNIGQNNKVNFMPNDRYNNQQFNYNEINTGPQFNGGSNGNQDKRSTENNFKEQSCTLTNSEGNNDNLKVSTNKILCQNNPQYMKCFENKKKDMEINNIINNNDFQNKNKFVNYNILNGPTKDMLDKALNNGNNKSEKFDSFTGKALNENLGLNINNNNNNGNTQTNNFRDQLSFTCRNNRNNYRKENNGNSNQLNNNINLIGNNNNKNHSRNNSSIKRSNGLNTEENYMNNNPYDSRKRASSYKNQKNEIFSRTFFTNGNNNVEISGDQIAYLKFKKEMKMYL
jgi:hypothetical protein